MPAKICPACNIGFIGRKERRYCSRQCQHSVRAREMRTCVVCSQEFNHHTVKGQPTCSKRCGFELKCISGTSSHKVLASKVFFRDCLECSAVFCTRHFKKTLCSRECRRKRNSDRAAEIHNHRYETDLDYRARCIAHAQSRRANEQGLGKKSILITYLIDRDGGLCRIPRCAFPSRKITPLGSKGPRRPTIDHIIPISKQGEHELHNVQLAHWRCNVVKNNKGSGDQLALIG